MTNQHCFVSADRSHRDLYTSSQAGERLLNAAIIRADISRGFEEYFEIFDLFYADDIEVRSEVRKESIRGKERVRSVLFNFLVPLHVMAEVGGLSISIRATPIPGDTADETHSAWTLDLTTASGTVANLSWCTLRKWNESRVLCERHYAEQQSGGPLTVDDLQFNAAKPRHQRTN